ncbi:hypothetical protein GCM10023334_017650 [Nonomuraea thailandensis]
MLGQLCARAGPKSVSTRMAAAGVSEESRSKRTTVMGGSLGESPVQLVMILARKFVTCQSGDASEGETASSFPRSPGGAPDYHHGVAGCLTDLAPAPTGEARANQGWSVPCSR